MALALTNLVNIFATPGDVFEKLKRNPQWLIAFLGISGVSVGIGLLTLPFAEQAAMLTLPANLGDEQVRSAVAMSRRLGYISLGLVPVVYLIRWLLVSAFLYFLSLLLGVPFQVTMTGITTNRPTAARMRIERPSSVVSLPGCNNNAALLT